MSEEETTKYQLTSYGPVSVTIKIPYVTGDDVHNAMIALAADKGGSEHDAQEGDWVRENLGFKGVTDFVTQTRKSLEKDNEETAESDKSTLCGIELSKRLVGDPDQELVQSLRRDSAIKLELQLREKRMSLRVFMRRHNISTEQLNKALDRQAMDAARIQAALSAYADDKGIEAGEDEWMELLKMPQDVYDKVMKKDPSDQKRQEYAFAARNAKALRAVVAECECTVVHETEKEARHRQAAEDALIDGRSGK